MHSRTARETTSWGQENTFYSGLSVLWGSTEGEARWCWRVIGRDMGVTLRDVGGAGAGGERGARGAALKRRGLRGAALNRRGLMPGSLMQRRHLNSVYLT